MSIDLSVYLVTDAEIATRQGHHIEDVVREAVAGGVTAVQVREKRAGGRGLLEMVTRLVSVADHVPVIVNDRLDVYLAARALGVPVAGVHVGQSDLPAALVRRLVGRDAIVGLSAATEAELATVRNDTEACVDYVGIGALHPTTTKTDAPGALGLEGFSVLARSIPLPAVAIGGVTEADMAGLRRAGAAGGAVVSAICAAADPRAAATALARAWESGA